MNILVAHTNPLLIEDLRYSFEHDGDQITVVDRLARLEELLSRSSYDLILSDFQLADGSVLQLFRDSADLPPILVISSQYEAREAVLSLEYGCEDYMALPIDLMELKARIRARLGRKGMQIPQEEASKLLFPPELENVSIALSYMEYRLLMALFLHRGEVLTREALLYGQMEERGDAVSPEELRKVDVRIRRLRAKLRPFGLDTWIETVWGEGYRYRKP